MRQPVPFGKYLLLDRISVGGMAEVFKAKSYGVEGFEKIIAIKRILPTMGEDRDFIKMFIDEAKIAGQLAHANICQIFELGRIDGSHFIAMEYIWGKDLLQIQNRLRKVKQQMPVPMACFSIAKVLEGLDYAHRKRDPLGRPLEIVHRDCSPQNVLVSYEGEVKVIDFGIAKATSRNSRTMAGVLKGKFGYMSPEQVRGLPLDRRSDIFALGTMLYECLTGERLFQGETDFSTLEKVRNVDIRAPRDLNPNIPEAVEKVILKALAKDVDDRYQWCSEMLTDLQAFLMSQDVVFTAKSLSSWLKEVFQQEIERERQQLETYKRVGRDGLIGGVPSAEANKDVVGQLGPAGEVEGDATTLGGPSFDDIEQALQANASPESAQGAAPARRGSGDDDDGDFGEEAPTEIFGELDAQSKPAPATPAAGARPTTNPPSSKPPKPPPGRPSTSRPQEIPVAASMAAGASGQHPSMRPQSTSSIPPMQPPPQQPQPQQMMYAAASPSAGMPAQYPQHPSQQNYYPQQQPGAMGTDPGQMGHGTPGSMPSQHPGLAQQNAQQGKTVLGMQAPPGMPNYANNNYRPSQPHQAQYPYPQNYPSGPMQQMPPPGYPPNMQGYGYPGSGPATPVDGQEGRRSTLVRDIMIGVAIAALVLGGFFIIKLFVLDKDEGPAATTSTIATVQLSITAGIAADMIVDNMRVGAVMDKQEIPLGPGKRHIVIAGPNGMKCDQTVTLEAGKTTTLKCDLSSSTTAAGSNAGSAAPAAGSDAGSAAGAAGSAAPTSGSGTSASLGTSPGASATVVVPDTKVKPDIVATTKPDTKIAETKPDTKVPETRPDTSKPVDKTVAHGTAQHDVVSGSHTTTPAIVATKDLHTTDTKKTTPKVTIPEPTKPDTTKPDTADVAGKGYLQVFSKPTAKILVDGVDSGMSTPISGHSLALGPGKHKVTFVMGDDRYTFPVTIKVGATETMSKDLQ